MIFSEKTKVTVSVILYLLAVVAIAVMTPAARAETFVHPGDIFPSGIICTSEEGGAAMATNFVNGPPFLRIDGCFTMMPQPVWATVLEVLSERDYSGDNFLIVEVASLNDFLTGSFWVVVWPSMLTEIVPTRPI